MHLRVQFTIVFLLACAAASSAAEPVDRQFVDGLLQRRLFLLAETHCRDELQDSQLNDRRRAELTAELTRTYTQWALHSPPDKRDTWWDKASQTVVDYGQHHADSGFAVIVHRQAALGNLTHGELARYEAEVVADSAPVLQRARGQLRLAAEGFEKLASQIDEQLRQVNRRPSDDEDGLTADELRILQHDIRHQLARTWRNQALCYPPGTPDRTSALQRAVMQLQDLAGVTDPINWDSRIELLACYRELGQADSMQQLFRQYFEDAPPHVLARVKLEQARQMLDLRQTDAALSLLEQRPALPPRYAAEWDFVLFEALLAGWRAEPGKTRAKDWQQRAARQVERIETSHGAYWMRRAEGILGHQVARTPATGDMALLVRAAEAYYRAGKPDEAVAAYDRASLKAQEQSQDDLAFETAHTAAAIQNERKQYVSARDRFRKLGLQFAEHPRAAEAHLTAAYHQARLLRDDPQTGVETYRTMLQEHLRQWPQAATASEAAWWLGRLHQSQHEWVEAIAAYKRISPDDSRAVEALQATSDCYTQWLRERNKPSQAEYELRATTAADYFADVARKADALGNDTSLLATVLSARFRVHYARRGYSTAERALQEALQRKDPADASWQARAQMYLAYSLAAQNGRASEARQELDKLTDVPSDALLEMVDGFSERIRDAADPSRRQMAELLLRAADRLQPGQRNQLDETARRRLDKAKAAAYAAAGRRDEAQRTYEALAKQNPKDMSVQEEYAQMLLDSGDTRLLPLALQRWRDVQRHSRPASPRWFRAKYGQALGHLRSGNPQQATRVIKLTEVLHPDLGGLAMKAKFVELLRRCQTEN